MNEICNNNNNDNNCSAYIHKTGTDKGCHQKWVRGFLMDGNVIMKCRIHVVHKYQALLMNLDIDSCKQEYLRQQN